MYCVYVCKVKFAMWGLGTPLCSITLYPEYEGQTSRNSVLLLYAFSSFLVWKHSCPNSIKKKKSIIHNIIYTRCTVVEISGCRKRPPTSNTRIIGNCGLRSVTHIIYPPRYTFYNIIIILCIVCVYRRV